MQKASPGTKVLVAMSGGVDSSVAAALLLEAGYQVVGCFMRLGSDDSVEMADEACDLDEGASAIPPAHHQGCCSLNDASDARLVAATLGIPFYVMNFKHGFGRIIDYFVDEYNQGRTPNPCIRCNTWLKFGKLADYAHSIDADYVATGHYARIEHRNGKSLLLRGRDHRKDQSYVLFGTRRDMLHRMLLPIGEHEKAEVRRIAGEFSLAVFDKPDSQEICFVPDNDYFGLVKRKSPERVTAGPIVTCDGDVVGQHDGHQQFTIGQRRGVSVSLGHPVYVVDKNPQTNTVTIGTCDDVLADGLHANQTNWLIDPPTGAPMPCQVKIRSNGPAAAAIVRAIGDDTMHVRFDEPQRAVSPGQAAVCYVGEHLVGGGWISHATCD